MINYMSEIAARIIIPEGHYFRGTHWGDTLKVIDSQDEELCRIRVVHILDRGYLCPQLEEIFPDVESVALGLSNHLGSIDVFKGANSAKVKSFPELRLFIRDKLGLWS